MVRCYNQYQNVKVIFWISLWVDSKDKLDFAMLFTLQDLAY
jgi:hypothetical protein